MHGEVSTRPERLPDDGDFLLSVYASTRRPEMSTSSSRIAMHVLEYSLTLSRPRRRLPYSLFRRSGRESDRFRADRNWFAGKDEHVRNI